MLPINAAAAEVIREAIANAERTEESVAAGARIRPKTWQRRIAGSTAFSINEISRIATVLGVKVAALVDAVSDRVSQGGAKP